MLQLTWHSEDVLTNGKHRRLPGCLFDSHLAAAVPAVAHPAISLAAGDALFAPSCEEPCVSGTL